MRTRKCLILSPLFLIFNNDLSEITNVKESFKNQNILDLFRFDKIKSITEYKFNGYNINFVYLPKNIEKIEYCAFYKNQIQILDLSNCIKLKNIGENVFYENKIKHLKLPDNIEEIYNYAFSINQIKILDLSNCIKLKEINSNVFYENPLTEIKILNDIKIDYDNNYDYKDDVWNKFVKYYHKNDKKAGDYKYIDNKWQWYPL